LLPVAVFFYPFVDDSFELCNNCLCTSSDVEAGFNYPISKKMYTHGPRPTVAPEDSLNN
jgi:hypothetical protein